MSAALDATETSADRDALQSPSGTGAETPWLARAWNMTWPLLAAVGLALAVWQLVFMTGWRPAYVFPDPLTVGEQLVEMLGSAELYQAAGTTLRRGGLGFAAAIGAGTLVGLAVARSRIIRAAGG
jgi:NitT/TauT family transport system permease protein